MHCPKQSPQTTERNNLNSRSPRSLPGHRNIFPVLAGGPGFDFADAVNTVGAPSFAFFAKGGYHERLQRRGARPLDGGTKSSSSLGSRAPAPIRPKDRNDNCSTATAPVSRPSLASLDCDVCTGASPRASWSSIH